MKISIDDVVLIELTDTQKKIIEYETSLDKFNAKVEKDISSIVNKHLDGIYGRMKSDWDIKLVDDSVTSAPLSVDSYSTFIFARGDYKDAATRASEAE